MPAPTVITDSDLSGLLKNLYTQYRQKVQNTVTPLYAQLRKAKEGGPKNFRWGGNGAFWDIITGRPAGGTVSANGYFPPDTFAQEKQASTGVARLYVTRQIDGLAFNGTKSKEAAFETIASKTLQEIREAASLMMEALLNGAGQGVLATIGTVTNTTTIIVSNPYGLTGAGQGSLLISVGDYIAVRDVTGATLRGKSSVTAISVSGTNSTLTLQTAITGMVATDILVKGTTQDDSYSATAGVNQVNGLVNITNIGNSYPVLHTQSNATYPIWDAVRTTPADPTQPTESDIWVLAQSVKGRSGKDPFTNPKQFLLMMTPGMAKVLMESFVGQRRFTNEDFASEIKGGYRAVNVCGMPCFENYYCPANTIYLIHIPSLAWVDAKDWGMVEYEGAGPWRWIQGRDAFETTYAWYGNLAALARNAHGVITGYTCDTQFFSHVV